MRAGKRVSVLLKMEDLLSEIILASSNSNLDEINKEAEDAFGKNRSYTINFM